MSAATGIATFALDRAEAATRVAAVIALLAAIVWLRAAMASASVDGVLSGGVFGTLLVGLATLAGRSTGDRPALRGALRRPRLTALLRPGTLGVACGGALVGLSWFARLQGPALPLAPTGVPFGPWALITILVAFGEEAVLRGSLFDATADSMGVGTAMVFTSVVFALLHVPTYGWAVVPLDFGVGLSLGGLRVLSRGATAPAVAHAVADLAAWLL